MSRFQKDYFLCHGGKKSIFNVIVSRIILLTSWCQEEFYQYHEMNDMYLLSVKIQIVVRSSVFFFVISSSAQDLKINAHMAII